MEKDKVTFVEVSEYNSIGSDNDITDLMGDKY